LKVIEDCAQAHGAKYKGRLAGSMGHMSAFSFCQDKIMSTTGEGGMLLLNDTEIYEKMWAFKDHGKSYDAVFRRQHDPGFRWLHDSFGTNWRMTEIQGAVGSLQLKKMESWVEKRRTLAHAFNEGLAGVSGLVLNIPSQEIYHSYYKYYVFVDPTRLKNDWNRDQIMAAIVAEGIPCFSGSCSEIYLEQAFQKKGLGPKERLVNASYLGEVSLMFMVHPTLDLKYVEDAVLAIRKVLNRASR